MNKELTVGTDYASIFGLDPTKKQHLIYQGGNKWLMKDGERVRETDSEKTTQNALAYINQPTVNMG